MEPGAYQEANTRRMRRLGAMAVLSAGLYAAFGHHFIEV